MTSVLQDWVMDLPLKMQSVLLTSTRGPDNFRYESVKVVNRWIRSHLFHDADPSNPFILKAGDPHPLSLLDTLEHDLEYVTVHYFGHLIHALQIIGYRHPNDPTRSMALGLYSELCQRILHLPAESRTAMEARLMS
jgi:hypothetical protein